MVTHTFAQIHVKTRRASSVGIVWRLNPYIYLASIQNTENFVENATQKVIARLKFGKVYPEMCLKAKYFTSKV